MTRALLDPSKNLGAPPSPIRVLCESVKVGDQPNSPKDDNSENKPGAPSFRALCERVGNHEPNPSNGSIVNVNPGAPPSPIRVLCESVKVGDQPNSPKDDGPEKKEK
ncbi:MAG: hypothetical protein WBE38_01015 [Terracidiphilus sp.]